MKKETRGRKPKVHAPLGVSFDEVLKAIGHSKYKPRKKKRKKPS
jgi:hypothetical protein